MSKPVNTPFFDGIPVAPYSPQIRGANFGVATYYIPIPYSAAAGQRTLQIEGDGTFAATATVQHTQLGTDLTGAAVDPRVAGDAKQWHPDTAIGTFTMLAAAGATAQDTKSWSNVPSLYSRLVLVVTAAGRARGSLTAQMES